MDPFISRVSLITISLVPKNTTKTISLALYARKWWSVLCLVTAPLSQQGFFYGGECSIWRGRFHTVRILGRHPFETFLSDPRPLEAISPLSLILPFS